MITNSVDGIIENVLEPGEEENQGLPGKNPRFKWKPSDAPSKPGAGAPPPAASKPGSLPGEPAGEVNPEDDLLDDRTGGISINQLLGSHRFATKDDLWAASDRMRSKLGPAGAAQWAAEYGKAEFEALARRLVDELLEGETSEDPEKKLEKLEKTSKGTKKSVADWMRGLKRSKPTK